MSTERVYRAMRQAHDSLPLVADTASGLGIREWEIEVDEGEAQPESGGMSVSPDAPENLPVMFLPVEHGGTGRYPVWELSLSDFGEELIYRPDPQRPDTHGFIEPCRPMPLEEYRQALWETRLAWRLCELG